VADYPLPDFAAVHVELARKGVTRWLLWSEYKATHPDGLQYTAFCNHYRRWRLQQSAVLRQVHAPGDKLFVDYAGQTVDIIDRHTGEVRHAQIFVAVLGCSNYTFAEATWTQTLPDWLGSHVRALQFFDGTPAAIVPDNLKSGVVKARRYEPDLNPAYQDFAEHYGMAILPARVRKPRDKAKVEGAVLIVERWILARLRHHTFFSLGQLNVEIERLMRDFNTRPFQKLDGCRQSRFDELERPALKPLPSRTYAFAQWKHAKVHPDYHIEVERAYYSVPYKLIGQRVDVRLTETMLEVFHQGQLVAAHARAHRKGEFVTVAAHRPAGLIRMQARMKRHPEQTLRSSQGIVRLAADFSPSQLEAACARALELHSYSYRAIRALITALPLTPASVPRLPAHPNVRGADYFQ
jgi:transposase